jgi:hypothetical protein
MRPWLRSHLTYANVMATLAVFLVLGGGTALGAYVVSSNSQIGPNTISGHKPATGQHANIIGGSVNGTDLASGSVNGAKVLNGSLTASDTDVTSLQRRVTGSCPAGQAATSVTQAGGLSCAALDSGNAGGISSLFGDGSDGDQTIATDTTLDRDTYYHDLTIAPDTTLNPGGFRVFVSGTLTFGDGAKIARDGRDVSDIMVAGPALSPGTLGGSGAGTADSPANSIANSLGGDGGDGGFMPGGSSGGSAIPPPVTAGGAQVFDQAMSALGGRALDGTVVNGGAGGAGGGSLRGGGSGGGVVVVSARTILVNGSAAITAKGGNGAGSSVDGGGGGGGGVVAVITGSAMPAGMTLSAAGGSAGDPVHAGSPGFTAWLK